MKLQLQTIVIAAAFLVVVSSATKTSNMRHLEGKNKKQKKSGKESSEDDDDDLALRAAFCQQYTDGVQAMFKNTVFPQNLEVLDGGLLPDIFLPEVKGRAHPLGAFSGFNNTLEYFYALTLGNYLESNAFGQAPDFVNIDTRFRYITCDVDQRLGIFDGTLNFGSPGVDTADTVPASSVLHFTGGARFNEDGKVCSYELNIARLGMFGNAKQKSAEKTINDLCLAVTFGCAGENQQYDSFEDCIAFMTSIDYGTFDNADLNTVSCRQLHVILALSRPTEHCTHVGKDGGGKCIDRDYANVTEGDYLLGIEGC